MKLGGFGQIADYDNIKNSGFDYAELDIPEIVDLSETDFQTFCEKVKKDRFPVLIGSRALPIAEPWFFTDQFSLKKYQHYMDIACIRAGKLGIRKIILGNGKARLLSDKSSMELEENFIESLHMYAQYAEKQGIEFILEPLGPDYSNYINTLPEAVRVVRKVDAPNLFIMADLRHLYRGGEPNEDIVACAEYVHHIHVDNPKTFPERLFPNVNDGFDYEPFLNAVKRSGYHDTLTIEADIPVDWPSAYHGMIEALKILL